VATIVDAVALSSVTRYSRVANGETPAPAAWSSRRRTSAIQSRATAARQPPGLRRPRAARASSTIGLSRINSALACATARMPAVHTTAGHARTCCDQRPSGSTARRRPADGRRQRGARAR
jgi:hypothetical protein